MTIHSKLHRSLLGLAGALALGAMIAGPAAAATSTASVTQQITSGTLTASIASGSMTSIAYSNNAQVTTGTVHLSVVDSSGSSAGWNVLVSSTAFVYTSGGSSNPSNIPNGGFTIVTSHDPTVDAGQPIDTTGGPLAFATSNGLDLSSPRKTVTTTAGFGSGSYGQDIDLQLAVPALSQAGTYTATLTVAINSGP